MSVESTGGEWVSKNEPLNALQGVEPVEPLRLQAGQGHREQPPEEYREEDDGQFREDGRERTSDGETSGQDVWVSDHRLGSGQCLQERLQT